MEEALGGRVKPSGIKSLRQITFPPKVVLYEESPFLGKSEVCELLWDTSFWLQHFVGLHMSALSQVPQAPVDCESKMGWNGSFAKWVCGNTRGILQSVTPGKLELKTKTFLDSSGMWYWCDLHTASHTSARHVWLWCCHGSSSRGDSCSRACGRDLSCKLWSFFKQTRDQSLDKSQVLCSPFIF